MRPRHSARHADRAATLIAAAAAAALAVPSLAAAGTAASWVAPASGNWTDAVNWSTAPNYPVNGTPAGATYDAVIDSTGAAYTVTLDASAQPLSTVAVDSVSLNSADATLLLSAGTFQRGR